VHLISFGKFLQELLLVDIAHTKLGQHHLQVWYLDELLLFPLASKKAV
jgi:hypothetical protein